jgi:hypothetical protein
MTRTLTLLLTRAEDPDELDEMSYEDRRANGGGLTEIELLYPGDPDTLVRMALAIDQGVYGAARVWDNTCVEKTAAIFATDVEDAAELLRPHLADPHALAKRFIEYAASGEDPARVARAFVEEMKDPARGPAEEAAAYVRLFLEYVPVARQLEMAIAWEIRTPATCACAVWEGHTLGQSVQLRGLEKLDDGRMRCRRCGGTFQLATFPNYVELTRETTPLPDMSVFAQDVARALGGEVAFDIARDRMCGVRVGRHCVVLIWVYGGYYRLGLPSSSPWKASTREEWLEVEPAIKKAVAGYRPVVSIGDVIASLPRTWNVGLTATPRPDEALLFNDLGDANLQQNAASVTLTIWQPVTRVIRELETLDALDGFAAWLDEAVAEQARARQAVAEAIAVEVEVQRASIRVPTLDEVLVVLRAGEEIQVGGGRSFPTYLMRNGQLIVVHCDDGYTEEAPCSEQALRDAIAGAPNVFDAVVQRRRRMN